MYSSPTAWSAPVVNLPAASLPLTALVIGFWARVAPLGTGALAVNAGSLSWVSPVVEAEQLAPLGAVVVVVDEVVVEEVVVGIVELL